MFLYKFIYVNWGNIPNAEFEMGPINLLSGGNGSGKTTSADAIQTVMTAAHENLFNYNPGQDETTQRGRGGKQVRTLASYVLGCDDGSFARMDCTDGYLAAVFRPTKGETGIPFTALMGVRARIEKVGDKRVARQEDNMLMILPEVELSLDKLEREDASGKYITPLDQLESLLIAEYGKRGVQKYDTKKGYLRRLYGALKGRTDQVTEREATHAAKTFSRFMAYKPVSSIDRFVAGEILEPKDMGQTIRDISELLKTIHGMSEEADRLLQSIDILEKGRGSSDAFISHWLERNSLDYQLALHRYKSRQKDYIEAKREQTAIKQALGDADGSIDTAESRSAEVHQMIIDLEAQRKGVSALQEKDDLETEAKDNEAKMQHSLVQLMQSSHAIDSNLAATETIEKNLNSPHVQGNLSLLTQKSVFKQLNELLQQGQRAEIDFQALANSDLTGDLSMLEVHLDQAQRSQSLHNAWVEFWKGMSLGKDGSRKDMLSPRETLFRYVLQEEQHYKSLKDRCNKKQREVERLQQAKVDYPHYVERALEAIRTAWPDADPRVLCDHVEVTDERWQMAIEGYLGANRFGILVAPQYEADAMRLVRRLPGRDNRAKVIQAEKAARDADRLKSNANSIIHVLEFSHASAKAYVQASYGSLQRVENADELRGTPRGISADGMASGGYSMFRCDLDDSQLVFGQGARQRALLAKQGELQELTDDWQVANDRMQQAGTLLKAVDKLVGLNYADGMSTLLSCHREQKRIDALLQQLDITAHADLEDKLQELKDQEQHWRGEVARLHQQMGEDKGKLGLITGKCQKLSDEQEQTQAVVEQWEDSLHAIAREWPDFNVEVQLDVAEQNAADLNEKAAAEQLEALKHNYQSCERELIRALDEHNGHCRATDKVLYPQFEGDYDIGFFKQVCNLQRDIDRIYNRFKNNILVEKQSSLREYKESFNNSFVSNFCHTLYQALEDGKRQIETLNEELQHHKFGADRESFRFDHRWKPEYDDFQKFFSHIVRNPSLGEGETLFDIELSPKMTKVRDGIMAMLLDNDEQRAIQELNRIADYRNYRHYEIYKQVEGKPDIALSQYGTGSGGQLETPAYIIRAAAVTSAFKFKEGSSHLRMVLVDEAFSKMDEGRSREVINYLTDALGLQLIFIMPSSKCGPFMDLISNEFVFAKCPSDTLRGELKTRVFVDRKALAQDKVAELWKKHKRVVYEQASLDFMEGIV